jgi:hypothetical protein
MSNLRLTYAQRRVLKLVQAGYIIQDDILFGWREEHSYASVTSTMKVLMRLGLVEEGPREGKPRRAVLTDAGRAALG